MPVLSLGENWGERGRKGAAAKRTPRGQWSHQLDTCSLDEFEEHMRGVYEDWDAFLDGMFLEDWKTRGLKWWVI